jgi:hypothetical protein
MLELAEIRCGWLTHHGCARQSACEPTFAGAPTFGSTAETKIQWVEVNLSMADEESQSGRNSGGAHPLVCHLLDYRALITLSCRGRGPHDRRVVVHGRVDPSRASMKDPVESGLLDQENLEWRSLLVPFDGWNLRIAEWLAKFVAAGVVLDCIHQPMQLVVAVGRQSLPRAEHV